MKGRKEEWEGLEGRKGGRKDRRWGNEEEGVRVCEVNYHVMMHRIHLLSGDMGTQGGEGLEHGGA